MNRVLITTIGKTRILIRLRVSLGRRLAFLTGRATRRIILTTTCSGGSVEAMCLVLQRLVRLFLMSVRS